MKKGRKINRVRCDIQSHIIAAGYTQKEAVEACSAEYGWSDSDSNFSAKLSDQTLRYREALELANVLGYEIVWQKRRDDWQKTMAAKQRAQDCLLEKGARLFALREKFMEII